MASIFNRSRKAWLPMVLAGVGLICLFGWQRLSKEDWPASSFFALPGRLSTLEEVKSIIEKRYVDLVNPNTLQGNTIDSLLLALDPHSTFIPEAELRLANEDLYGNFKGIGVEFQIFKDTVHVTHVMKGGPGEKAGLQIGDQFLRVGDTVVTGEKLSSTRIRNLLRGPGTAKLNLSILRAGKERQVTIIRDVIQIPAIDAAYMINDTVGYVKLNKFSENSYEDFMTQLETMTAKGMKSLILDLRDNGGGILQEAVDIADEFLDSDKMITYTEGAHAKRQSYRCKRPGLFEKGKLVLLINEGSASASEVLAGAMQDWDRATIVGRRSFGKGLVQEQFDLRDGSAIRLTIARYYTPNGRSIQKPYQSGFTDYEQEIEARWKAGALSYKDSNHIKQGKAFQTKSGRTVYEHGGIMPEIFVPLDSVFFSAWIDSVFSKNLVNAYAYHYFMGNQRVLLDLATVNALREYVDADQKWWPAFILYCENNGVVCKPSPSIMQRELITTRLTATIARYRWHHEGYQKILNDSYFEPFVIQALKVMNP
jgi:carboxyl-terminal processing protease